MYACAMVSCVLAVLGRVREGGEERDSVERTRRRLLIPRQLVRSLLLPPAGLHTAHRVPVDSPSHLLVPLPPTPDPSTPTSPFEQPLDAVQMQRQLNHWIRSTCRPSLLRSPPPCTLIASRHLFTRQAPRLEQPGSVLAYSRQDLIARWHASARSIDVEIASSDRDRLEANCELDLDTVRTYSTDAGTGLCRYHTQSRWEHRAPAGSIE